MKFFRLKEIKHPESIYINLHHDGYFYITSHTLSELKKKNPPEILPEYTKAEMIEIDGAKSSEIKSRVIFDLHSFLQDPPPDMTLEELYLKAYLCPDKKFYYVGRLGHHQILKNTPSQTNQIQKESQIIDIYGGRRNYHWQEIEFSQERPLGNEEPSPEQRWQSWYEWLQEPNTRIVLSLSSGGLRMHALSTLFKILDINGSRKCFHEIWGCSGGALAGLIYAKNITPHRMDQIGFDFYHEKYEDFALKTISPMTILRMIKNKIKNSDELFKPGLVNSYKYFSHALKKGLEERSRYMLPIHEIPFYALATNSKGELFTLSEKINIKPYQEEFILETSAITAAVASASIPLLIQPVEEVIRGQKMTLMDAGPMEEIPIASVVKKWKSDLENAPETTPPKLKIFYVNLNLRAREIGFMQKSSFFHDERSTLKHVGQYADEFFDSKFKAQLDLARASENVEVKGIDLNLGLFGAIDAKLIPDIIEGGRKDIPKKLDQLEEIIRQQKLISSKKNAA